MTPLALTALRRIMAQNYVLLILGSDFGLRPLTAYAVGAQSIDCFYGFTFVEFHSFLEQCKENIVLGHRSCEHMHSLISSLKGIINAFLNGQLVSQETEFLDFQFFVGTAP